MSGSHWKRPWILASILGSLGIAGMVTPVSRAQTRAATSQSPHAAPHAATTTSAPPAAAEDAGTDRLIKQLGSDDPGDRDAAQRQLVNEGSVAMDALKIAAAHSVDPEIRSRAAAALSQIADHLAFDASSITLHLKNVAGQDALEQIAAQADAQFAGLAPGVPASPVGSTVSIDASAEPFWDVMTDFCKQVKTCPTLDPPTKNTMKLFPAPRNWFLDSPHKIVGPYWVGVAGMNRVQTIDLMGPEQVEDQFTMQLIVYPEPKLAVTQISDFDLKEATDDAGNSLIPTAPAAPRGVIAALAIVRNLRNARNALHTIEARLAYPKHPGKKIAILRGGVTVTLAEGLQQLVIDDVLGTPKQTNPIKRCTFDVHVTHNGPDFYQVAIECTREGMADDQWQAIANRVNDITLEDAAGHALTLSYVTTPMYDDTSFKSTALFTRNIYGAQQQAFNRAVTGHTGDAKRLTWNIATRLKQVTVPVTFTDLPMPQ